VCSAHQQPVGWQRQAESPELADGLEAQAEAIGKLRLPLPPGRTTCHLFGFAQGKL
jgi:hypothetical protein